MAEGAGLADAAYDRGERLREDVVAEQFPRGALEPVGGRSLVSAVEVAEEVAAVAPVEGEQGGRLLQLTQGEAGALHRVEVAGGQPRVALDDVRRDERVLQI